MKPARILLIDDDLSLTEQLTNLLQTNGNTIEQYHDGESGLLAALNQKFDVILSSVSLPIMDGLSMLNQLRKSRQTPVMMLTADEKEQERIDAYTVGADDYLPKSVNLTEIQLRINALLRRTKWSNHHKKNKLSTGGLTLLKNKKEVVYEGVKIILTPIQFKLLWVLVEHQNEVLKKSFLYQTVLERPFSQYDRSLDMHLSRIRKKLIEANMPAEHFVTVHGIGYLFN